MKYYYTDPLAAAWMEKHHGVRYIDNDMPLSGKEDSALSTSPMIHKINFDDYVKRGTDGLVPIHKAICLECDEADEYSAAKKYYLHPNTLHLLQPQVGDVLLSDWPEHGKENPEPFYFFEGRGVYDCHTIQRKGIPFMWPEAEK